MRDSAERTPTAEIHADPAIDTENRLLQALNDAMSFRKVKEMREMLVTYRKLDPKDIDITMENGVLSLRGRRSHEKSTEENGFRRIERSSGEFFRRFTLPDVADSEQISAQTNNGVLTVRIAKRPEVQPKKIEVKAS